MNDIKLIGRITRTPDFRDGQNPRCRFTVAIDGAKDKTDFVPVTCFGNTAQAVAQYTDKGHLVAIEGRITSGKYTDDSGNTVYTTSSSRNWNMLYTLDVIANRVQFLSRPQASAPAA